MAWRIDEVVTHGEIDNTEEGQTTGKIWLAGRDAPLELNLAGDCWRDLAGTKLTFKNPQPKTPESGEGLADDQSGVIGDMTASRRYKLPAVDEEEFDRLYQAKEEIPYEWRNTLYLEWFSDENGRVVIETQDFELKLTQHVWSMDEDAEDAQKLANLNAMRDFMAQIIQRREPNDKEENTVTKEMDEFAWEERLKESDRLTDAYQEVLEKYMDDGDSEQKEAFVMGWDGLLDAMAEREEVESGYLSATETFEETSPEDYAPDNLEFDVDKPEEHPLQLKAQELATRAMDLVQRDANPGTPAYQLVTSLLQVSGKLAGALNGGGLYEPETGYVLAVLKRCLNWLNEAVGACQELMTAEEDKDQLVALAHIRGSAFEIRDSITELRRQLK